VTGKQHHSLNEILHEHAPLSSAVVASHSYSTSAVVRTSITSLKRAAYDWEAELEADFYRFNATEDLADARTVIAFGPDVSILKVIAITSSRYPTTSGS
jgi:hypothetical protein